MTNNKEEREEKQQSEQKPTLVQVVGSILASFFGVQSSKNKERDFQHGNHRVFIIMGVVITGAFIGGLFLLVQLVMHLSAS